MSLMRTQQRERRWYVVQTYSGYENRVKADLDQRIKTMGMENNIFNVLIPEEERIVVKVGKNGKLICPKVKRKLYPSYVLVEMVLDEQSWHVVRHTPGVTAFVGAGTHPLSLSKDEVDRMMAYLAKSKEDIETVIDIDIKVGDVVTVKEGPGKGQSGPVVAIEFNHEKGKVKFTVRVGPDTVLETDYQLLEKL